MEFSKLILEAREKTGLSRTAFHSAADFRFSCQTYKRMEDGEIGQIDHVIEVLKALKLDLKKGILAWLRDQLPSEDLKSFFLNEISDLKTVQMEEISAEKAIVIHKGQARLLSKSPIYWEIVNYLKCHFRDNPSLKKIARDFKKSESDMLSFLNELEDQGLVSKRRDIFETKKWVFIGDEFQELRKQNFLRSFEQFQKIDDDQKFFITSTTHITKTQQIEATERIKTMITGLLEFEDSQSSCCEKETPFTVGIFASQRMFGDK